MVVEYWSDQRIEDDLSVLALSSRFDGRPQPPAGRCPARLSVLALSSRFDGHSLVTPGSFCTRSFSTRSVESF